MHDDENTLGSTWRPITLTCKQTGRSVNISILDREFYLSGILTFADLWEMYAEPTMEENSDDE